MTHPDEIDFSGIAAFKKGREIVVAKAGIGINKKSLHRSSSFVLEGVVNISSCGNIFTAMDINDRYIDSTTDKLQAIKLVSEEDAFLVDSDFDEFIEKASQVSDETLLNSEDTGISGLATLIEKE